METNYFKGSTLIKTKDFAFKNNFKVSKKSFREVVNAYKQEIYTFLSLVTGDKELAIDISKMIFVKSYYMVTKINDPDQFKLWLYKKTYLTALKALKNISSPSHNKIDIKINTDTDNEYFDLEGDGTRITYKTYDLTTDYNALNNVSCLAQIFDKMDFDMRIILILKDILKENSSFIASIINVTEGTVNSTLAKARYIFATEISNVVIESRGTL